MALLLANFYKFIALPDYEILQPELSALCQQHQLLGTILLAAEGINGTLVGEKNAISQVLATLKREPRFADLEIKTAVCDRTPFQKLKVRLKKEIVTFGVPDADPTHRVGKYIPPQEWNKLITDPDVTLIDTRNRYEIEVGTFAGAVDPAIDSFSEFADYADTHLNPETHKKVALFCTGGIRCEKATAYLLNQGYEEVYHLHGGILKYLEEIPETESTWQGECFVFDGRVAVKHKLEPGSHILCFACGHPLSPTDQASPLYQPHNSCPHCWGESESG